MKKNIPYDPSRRSFLKKTAKGGSFLFMDPFSAEREPKPDEDIRLPESLKTLEGYGRKLNLAPARWIWYPSRRTLPNTVIHFRKNFNLPGKITDADGWILGESRYQLYVNGQRIQFGPAPNDPRYAEADRMDLKDILTTGENCIGVETLFYGYGDGTWPIGKPGFIFRLDITPDGGTPLQIISDGSWDCEVAPAWNPGQYKRWYLRAFQEEFDNRHYPEQWHTADYTLAGSWRKAMELNNAANLPALCSDYPEYMLEIQGEPDRCELRERTIPPILEKDVFCRNLAEKKYLRWIHSPETYFMMVTPDAYETAGDIQVDEDHRQTWSFTNKPEYAVLLTFEFEEQTVGFPFFSIEAPEGTVVEMLVQEGHETGTEDPLMNNHFHSWSRFICKKGLNHFRTFDFESLRWLQLHIRNGEGKMKVSGVGIRRRRYDWPNQPEIQISDTRVQQVVNASINTIHNAAQETIVDGMGRERQQYSGDVGHQLHAIFYTFGEYRLPARYLNTYSQGLTYDGYFLDSWPAYDRLARLMERQLDLTRWGPILDHSIGFNFDAWHYYAYTGDLNALKEVYPRLLVFKNYLKKLVSGEDGLLPVENLGIPYVWIDHNAYREQKHKQCAFNLYAAAMLSHALAPLSEALDDPHNQNDAAEFSVRLLGAVMDKFYSPADQMLIVNKPWLPTESGPRYCDRSLATAILFDQIPAAARNNALRMLVEKPAAMGLSYPANAGWRYWALAKGNRMDVVVDEIRNVWAEMPSVKLNNTLQEDWDVHPDSNSQWSHCPVAPLYLVYMGLLGLHPLSPGFGKIRIRPQPGDLSSVRIVANTIRGPVRLELQGLAGSRKLMVRLPVEMSGELELDPGEKVQLKEIKNSDPTFRKYLIPGGENITLKLKYT